MVLSLMQKYQISAAKSVGTPRVEANEIRGTQTGRIHVSFECGPTTSPQALKNFRAGVMSPYLVISIGGEFRFLGHALRMHNVDRSKLLSTRGPNSVMRLFAH